MLYIAMTTSVALPLLLCCHDLGWRLHHESITVKITLKVQPHWKTTETKLKSFTEDNHAESFSLITLKFVCYWYPRMLIPYNPTDNFQRYSYHLFSQVSALLWFFTVIFSVIFLYSDLLKSRSGIMSCKVTRYRKQQKVNT